MPEGGRGRGVVVVASLTSIPTQNRLTCWQTFGSRRWDLRFRTTQTSSSSPYPGVVCDAAPVSARCRWKWLRCKTNRHTTDDHYRYNIILRSASSMLNFMRQYNPRRAEGGEGDVWPTPPLNPRPCAAFYSIKLVGGGVRWTPPSRSAPDGPRASRKKTSVLPAMRGSRWYTILWS